MNYAPDSLLAKLSAYDQDQLSLLMFGLSRICDDLDQKKIMPPAEAERALELAENAAEIDLDSRPGRDAFLEVVLQTLALLSEYVSVCPGLNLDPDHVIELADQILEATQFDRHDETALFSDAPSEKNFSDALCLISAQLHYATGGVSCGDPDAPNLA